MKKKRCNVGARRRFLGMEQLESRAMLAGNVNAFVSGGTLHINGDAEGNEITIEQFSSRSFSISSRDGATTINGQTDSATFDGVGKNLTVSLGGGDDVVELIGTDDAPLVVKKSLNIAVGSGNDQVFMSQVRARELHINLGAGSDLLDIGQSGAAVGATITRQAVIMGRGGQDQIAIANSLYKKTLTVDVGAGDDDVTIQNTTVRKTSLIKAGSGSDTYNRSGNHGKIKTRGVENWTRNVSVPDSATEPTASDDTATVVRGATTSISVATNDSASGSGTLDLASVVITQAPANGTAVANSDGSISYTNNGAASTTDTLQYTIKDQSGKVSNVATVTITVSNSLVAVSDSSSVSEDASSNAVTGNVLTNDTGSIGTKTVTTVSGSSSNVGVAVSGQFGTFQINSDGSYTYTLNNSNASVNALSDGQTLTDSMTYVVSAGNETASTTLIVTIQGHTDTALASVDDTASVTEDASPNTVTGNVLSNDTNAAGTTSVTTVNGSSGNIGVVVSGQFGTFQINSDGSYTYTLDNSNASVNALSDGQTLTDTMGYSATDGSTSSSATLTVTIQGHTDTTFSVVDDAASVTEDASPNTVTGNVLSNETNPAGTISVIAVNGSSGNIGAVISGQFGTFQINSDGSYTYTLDNSNATVNALSDGQTLSDAMSYSATDGTTSASATLTITIQGHTDTSFAALDDAASIAEDASPNTVTGNVLSNEINALGSTSVTAVSSSSGNIGAVLSGQFGTFQINSDGSYTYTLDNSNANVNALSDGQTLTDALTYTSSDGTTSASATLTVTIQGHTDTTFAAVDDAASITEDASPNTVTGNVLSNETNALGSTSVTAVNGSAGNIGAVISSQFGTFQINGDGSYTYTLNNSNASVNALSDGQTLTDTMSYTASDGTASASATLTVTIQGHTDTSFAAVDDAASITEDASSNTVTGNILSNDTDAAGTTSVSVVNGSSGNIGSVISGQFGTFQINSDGSYTYTLDDSNSSVDSLGDGQILTDTMSYTATDGVTSGSATLTVTIQGHTDLVFTAVNDAATVIEDASPETATGNVLSNDTNALGATSVTAVNGSSGSVGTAIAGQFGTFQINSDGSYTYTLDNNNASVNALSDGQTLTDSMGYTANDGTTSSSTTLAVTIQGHTDTTFTAVDDAASIAEDASPDTVTGNVLSNEINALGATSVTAVNGSSGSIGTAIAGQFGTFQINSDGSYTYTLDNSNATVNALSDGQTLTDTMAYTANDGTASASAAITVTIQGHTDTTFAAVDDAASVTEDASPDTVTGNVLSNETDALGATSVTAVNGSSSSVGTAIAGQFGTFQINSDGSYTYTLDNSNATVNALSDGQVLTDTMAYTANDGTTSASATLTVTIQGHADATFAAVDDTASITEDASPDTVTGNVLSNDTNAAGTASVTAVNGSSGNVGAVVSGQFGTFQINSDGSYTYTLDNTNATVDALGDNESLTDAISYTADDGTTSVSATLTITIQGIGS